LVVSVLALAGCGGPLTYTPRATARAPEADATIVADVHRDQSMTNLNIRIQHLAPPDRIQAGGTTYVVWSRHNQAMAWNRIGMLQYNPSSREAMLQATAPETLFDLQISVENNPTPGAPSPNVVLMQRVGATQ
jgi:hypothetical protein